MLLDGAEMSWRDRASSGAQDDLDGLLNAVLLFAEKMLTDHGEVLPYAAAVPTNGDMRMIAGWTGEERPASNELLDTLYEGVRARVSDTRAAAFVSDVRVAQANPGDAIRVELDHREGVSLIVLRPYRL